MCGSAPKAPASTAADKPAVLLTAGEGGQSTESAGSGRKKLRVDLNNATSTPYGSSLVIPS